MGINSQIEKFQSVLLNNINNCGLPIGVAYLVVKDLCNMLYSEYTNSINQELKQDNNENVTFELAPDESGVIDIIPLNDKE